MMSSKFDASFGGYERERDAGRAGRDLRQGLRPGCAD